MIRLCECKTAVDLWAYMFHILCSWVLCVCECVVWMCAWRKLMNRNEWYGSTRAFWQKLKQSYFCRSVSFLLFYNSHIAVPCISDKVERHYNQFSSTERRESNFLCVFSYIDGIRTRIQISTSTTEKTLTRPILIFTSFNSMD